MESDTPGWVLKSLHRIMWEFDLYCAVNNQWITWLQQGNKRLKKVTTAKYYEKETFLHSSVNVNIGYFSPFALLEISLLDTSKYVGLDQF